MGFFDNIDWINGIVIPLVETIVVLGFVGFISFVIVRAVLKTWQRSTKWFVKYSIKRTAYPIETMQWIANCIEKGMSYYDVKKKLLLSMKDNAVDMDMANEVLWLYDKTLYALKKEKGGIEKYGGLKNGYCPVKGTATSLPTV